MNDPTNTEGPAGTHGCACAHHDAVLCVAIRYDDEADRNERCECVCHQRDEDEEDAS